MMPKIDHQNTYKLLKFMSINEICDIHHIVT